MNIDPLQLADQLIQAIKIAFNGFIVIIGPDPLDAALRISAFFLLIIFLGGLFKKRK